MIDNFKIVDGHTHTFSSSEIATKIIESFNNIYSIEFENPGTGAISDILPKMDENGIDYTIMANFAPPKILHSNNLWSIKTSQEHKNLIALVSFHPDMEGSLANYLDGYIREGAKGIKIHPMAQGFAPDHIRLDEVYEYCNKVKLPIVFHCGRVANARLNEYADLEMLLPIIEKYPAIPFVLTHMADGNIKAVKFVSKNYENVYFDTSIVISGYPPIMNTNEPSWTDDTVVETAVNSIGAERILFGSDYPWGSPIHDIKRIMGMKLDNLQKKLILGENSIKLFNIE